MDFAVPMNYRDKIQENERKEKYLNLAGELKKLLSMKMTVTPVVVGTLSPKDSKKKSGGIRNQRKNRDHPDHSIVEIG